MIRRILLFIFISLFSGSLLAQPLTAYVNMQNEFMVFDESMPRKIEFMPPTSYKIGRTNIAYLDNSRSFKIYANGNVNTINVGFTNSFFVTDNLVAFLNQKSLNVFDKGITKNLAGVCDQYFIGDSIVVFLDSYKGEYKAYYNGLIFSVETYFQDSMLNSVKVGCNIVAYNNFANQFRIFFHGKKIAQEDFQVQSFEVGRNTVAYVDNDRKFRIFHNGRTTLADDFAPRFYKAANDMVAYESNDGYFKIFYNDSIYNMGYFRPVFQLADNVVAFKDGSGIFKVFYKGVVTDLDNYYPGTMRVQYNSVAYLNQSNELRLFSDGEIYEVTNADLTKWQLSYDVILYQIGEGIFRVYYKGNEYGE